VNAVRTDYCDPARKVRLSQDEGTAVRTVRTKKLRTITYTAFVHAPA
jgi:hypothetical protein